MKQIAVIFVLALLSVFSPTFAANYSGGSGTSTNPYIIATKADLLTLGATTGDYDKHFLMTSNIDLAGESFNAAVIAPHDGSDRFFVGDFFSGNFDGNGFAVKNLTITENTSVTYDHYKGLFGYIIYGAQISNLGIENCNIIANSYTGGLVGYNHGDIINCYATGNISADSFTGGLVGDNSFYGSIINCYATGNVSVVEKSAGGLVGYNSNSINNCYATGDVSANQYAGGLVGSSYSGSITNCYATGNISATNYAGGLVGCNYYCYIANCFWDTESSGMTVGCNLGRPDSGAITNVVGKTTAQMQDINTFINAGWDFVNETANGYSQTWQIASGQYPQLTAFTNYSPPILLGNGTVDNPYQIGSPEDIGAINYYDLFAYYVLTNDIDLANTTYTDAVIPIFHGIFDGNGYSIYNLTIAGGNYCGLFGKILDGSISNLSVKNNNIEAVSYTGGLVGYNNSGLITNCYVSGDILAADRYTGGLVGYNDSGEIIDCHANEEVLTPYSGSTGGLIGFNLGKITNCYANGNISAGELSAGGLIGFNRGEVTNCFATGDILEATSRSGGLVGYNEGKITNCHATGDIWAIYDYVGGLVGYNDSSSITNCYATGDILAATNYTGGLIGCSYGKMTNCYATGNITAWGYSSGGLAGAHFDEIINCYATGKISAETQVGGLIGRSGGTLSNCYSTGTVYAANDAGGLVGYKRYGDMTNCFWDIVSSGMAVGYNVDSSSSGTIINVVGKTTAQMRTQSTFTDAGWDFGSDGIWAIPTGARCPVLVSFPIFTVTFNAGDNGNIIYGDTMQTVNYGNFAIAPIVASIDGWYFMGWDYDFDHIDNDIIVNAIYRQRFNGKDGISEPLEIVFADELKYFSNNSNLWGRDVELKADIDCSQVVITPIGSIESPFNGTLNGCGYIIENLAIRDFDQMAVGLFGIIGKNALVKNFGIIAEIVAISRANGDTGLIAGQNFGTISNCYGDGSVIGHYITGGLVGYNAGSISNSYSLADCNGQFYVGGLVGENSADIIGCYAKGQIQCSMSYNAQGITPANYGYIANCIDLTNTNIIPDFATLGWDTINNNNNGMLDLWYQQSGQLPKLFWQWQPAGDVDYDSDVDYDDMAVGIFQWLSEEQTGIRLLADINMDGEVNLEDFVLMAEDFKHK
ncbi:MAG: GLUG motif-containing protein [Sedimentisphaeraceae bacterium JB056]